jgi:type II secretion system protein N
MRVPVHSRSRRAGSRHQGSRQASGGFVYAALATLIALAAFAVALARHLSPDTVLQPALEDLRRSAGIDVRYEESRFGWGEIVLEEVALGASDSARGTGDARLGVLTLQPSLWGLALGRSGTPWHAESELYGGTAQASLDGEPDDWTGTLTWKGINFAELQELMGNVGLSGSTTGRLDAADGSTGGGPLGGSWDVSGENIMATGLKSGGLEFPPIRVDRIASVGNWAGRTATVSRLDAEGSPGTVELAGKIILRTPLEQSALRMQLTHIPPKSPTGDLAPLMKMLLPPGAANRPTTYRVGGTLAMPTLTPVAGP